MAPPHHAGHLKQHNKKHKGEKKRCTDNLHPSRQNRFAKVCKGSSKLQRRLSAKQRRCHKISIFKRLMQHRGSEENPILCVLIPLAADIPINLAQLLIKTCDPEVKYFRNKIEGISSSVHINSGSLKKCFTIVTACFENIFACIDLAYLADWIVFLVPSVDSEICTKSGGILTALYSQGFLNASFAVMSSGGDLSQISDAVGSRFHIPDGRIHRLNTKADAFNLLKHISVSSGHQKGTERSIREAGTQNSAARFRSGMLVDTICSQNISDQSEELLVVTGYLRGSGMFLSDPVDPQCPTVHLAGWGDFPLFKAEWTTTSGNQRCWSRGNDPQFPQPGSVLLPPVDAMITDSDDGASNSEEDDSMKSCDEDEDIKLPENNSNEDDTSDCQPDNESTFGNSVFSATSAFSTAQLAKFRDARLEELFPDEVETPPSVPARERFSKYRGLPRSADSVWPTELDTLPEQYTNIACFKDYHRNRRSMIRYVSKRLSAHQNPDSVVSAPSYSTYIPAGVCTQFTIGPLSRTQVTEIISRHKLADTEETATIGSRKNVDGQNMTQPLVLWSLLPHETRVSVCHFNMHRLNSVMPPSADMIKAIDLCNSATQMNTDLEEEANRQEAMSNFLPPSESEPIKSKELMLFQAGIRRFVASPIYSSVSANLHGKTKFERFLTPSRTGTLATVYAPVMYAPTNVLQFRMRVNEDDCSADQTLPYVSELVATGNLYSVNPYLVILKRILLSGHPYKINKRHLVSRFMFFNPVDVEYFKHIPLMTKNGAAGHIKEPVGTHGHMKCVFDRKINSSDVVLMPLYKRLFPRWICDPRSAEALRVQIPVAAQAFEEASWCTSADQLQLQKKRPTPVGNTITAG